MKRFFSLALALCLSLSMATISAKAAITAVNITKTGSPGKPIAFTAKNFEDAVTGETASLTSLTITAVSPDGTLRLASGDVRAADIIPWAQLNTLTFNPKPGFHGITEFSWTATDNDGNTTAPAKAILDLTVHAPTANADMFRCFINTTINGVLTGTDPQNMGLTFILESDVRHGDVRLSPRGSFSYTPDKDFVGDDTFTFSVTNGYLTSAAATVTIKVANVKAPTASTTSYTVDYHGTVKGTLTGTDPNTPANALTFAIVNPPTKGTITSFDAATGNFTYLHNSDLLVSDTFTFRVNNGYLWSDAETITIHINPPTASHYRDMTNHWASFSAGVLRTLDIAIGEEIQKMYYFNPTKPVTRAEFSRFINAILKIPLSKNHISHFADVTEPYQIESINAMYEHGITGGTMVGTRLYFYPERHLTRIEAMKMIDNAMKFAKAMDLQLNFRDTDLIPDWAVQSVKNLVGYRIVGGSNNYLRPLDNITRAEVAQLMYLVYLENNK
ncbi:MAG: Ig-like domain-containing protein [Oscillospiraceae bacterium]|nr:Ig-like domain-containing protein [Oscillospiraceae bacterium]